MGNKWLFVILFLISVFLSSVSQVILKKSANKTHASAIKEYLNVQTIGAYALFFLSTLLTVYSYKGVSLSMGPILETTGYIWVSLLGFLLLKEKISKKKLAGLGLIIVGIIICFGG